MLTSLAHLLEPWSDLFRASAALQAVALFGHLGGIALAGGFAVTTDRVILRVRLSTAAIRTRALRHMRRVHGIVLAGLTLAIITGIATLLADIQDLLPSWIFWLKMLLVSALLVNGGLLRREGRGLLLAMETQGLDDPKAVPGDGWSRLRTAAARSAILWAVTILVGILLTTV